MQNVIPLSHTSPFYLISQKTAYSVTDRERENVNTIVRDESQGPPLS